MSDSKDIDIKDSEFLEFLFKLGDEEVSESWREIVANSVDKEKSSMEIEVS